MRSAGDDGQDMELLLSETGRCCLSRDLCGQAAGWLRCQYCGNAAERNSPASPERSVFGAMQNTAVAVQSNTTGGGGIARNGVNGTECFSQPPDLEAGLPPPSAPDHLA